MNVIREGLGAQIRCYRQGLRFLGLRFQSQTYVGKSVHELSFASGCFSKNWSIAFHHGNIILVMVILNVYQRVAHYGVVDDLNLLPTLL